MLYQLVPPREIGTAMGIYGLGVVFAEVRAALASLPRCDDPWQAAKDVGLGRFVEFLSGEAGLPRECIDLWFSHPALLNRYLDINHRWERMLAEFFAAQRGVWPDTDLDSQVPRVRDGQCRARGDACLLRAGHRPAHGHPPSVRTDGERLQLKPPSVTTAAPPIGLLSAARTEWYLSPQSSWPSTDWGTTRRADERHFAAWCRCATTVRSNW